MSYAFDHLDLIEKALRQPPFGLITDIDGTISQPASTPQQAKISPLCRHYLSILCHRIALVAVTSGRRAGEVKDMVGIDGIVYIGNHGLERWAEGHSEFAKDVQNYSKVIKAVVKELNSILSIEGIWIEDKGVTASIHYRLCPEPQLAERYILTALENLPQVKSLRILQEKKAIDLLPPVMVNKGTATLDLIQEYNLQGGIYLGDDFTDIDAFRAIHAASQDLNFQGFAIAITSQEMHETLVAEADFTLNGINDVERFLKWMSQTALELS